MIKLEDIEFKTLFSRLEIFYPNINIHDSVYIKKFLQDNNITNYNSLYENLQNNKDIESLEPLRYLLNLIIAQINKANEKGVEPSKYLTNGYSSKIDELTIEKTESAVNGSILLLSPPTSKYSQKKSILSTTTIRELKYLLSHTTPRGDSAFANSFHRISNGNASLIVKLINFFEEQVIRQYEESDEIGVNIFALNKKEKESLVEEKYSEIISYLTDTSEGFIWGGNIDFQKRRISSSIAGKQKIDIITKTNLIEIISNYTTLTELKTDPVKTKVLDRFKSTN